MCRDDAFTDFQPISTWVVLLLLHKCRKSQKVLILKNTCIYCICTLNHCLLWFVCATLYNHTLQQYSSSQSETCKHMGVHLPEQRLFFLFGVFVCVYSVYLVHNETGKSPADLCRAVILSEIASLWKKKEINAGNYKPNEIFFIVLMLHLPNFKNNHTSNYL